MLCDSINRRSAAFLELSLYFHSCSLFQWFWRRIGEVWVSISGFLYSEYAIAVLYGCTILLLQRFCVRGRLLLLFAPSSPPSDLSGGFYPLVCSLHYNFPVSLTDSVWLVPGDLLACRRKFWYLGLMAGLPVKNVIAVVYRLAYE